MTDQPGQTVIPEETILTPLALDGEPPSDKGFTTEGGTKLRARVVQSAIEPVRAPTNGDAALAPGAITLSISLAALADDLTVATDASGALLIMDRHEVLISGEALRNPAFDPAAAVEAVLRQQAALLEHWLTNQEAVAAYLASAWGGGTAPD